MFLVLITQYLVMSWLLLIQAILQYSNISEAAVGFVLIQTILLLKCKSEHYHVKYFHIFGAY